MYLHENLQYNYYIPFLFKRNLFQIIFVFNVEIQIFDETISSMRQHVFIFLFLLLFF